MRLPPGYRPGAVMLEVLRGGFVSDPRPVLVLESAAAVADIERLDAAKCEGAPLPGPGCVSEAPDRLVGKRAVAALAGWLGLRVRKHMHSTCRSSRNGVAGAEDEVWSRLCWCCPWVAMAGLWGLGFWG